MSQGASEVSFIGTGDCGPVHGPKDGFPVERYTEPVRPALKKVDLRLANCERQYFSRGTPSERAPHGRQPPEMAKIFTNCGFDAVTIANNHTRALLLEKGIQVTGAGKDLDEARQPAIVERNGVRIGFLGYCSVIPVLHWGVIWVPRVIADYQVTVAHACIDAGADMIMGHHAHVPKAVEIRREE